MQEEKLRHFLESNRVPIEAWGSGEAKTLEHLLKELNEGESILQEGESGLLRVAESAVVNVFYNDYRSLKILWEKKQIFTGGRERVRENLAGSIGEKMHPGEDPLEAAYRALGEELDIHERLPLTPKGDERKGPVPSASFPGLHTLYILHIFEVFLPKHLYRKAFVEHQKDKSSFFSWLDYGPFQQLEAFY